MQTSEKLKKTAATALFCAIAYIFTFIFHIKIGGFLTFDAKDAVITIGAMFFGPLSGIVISLIVSFFEFVTVSDTGFWGFLMNFFQSAVFAFSASIIYKYRRKLSGAITGLAVCTVVTTVLMMPANLLIVPVYSPVSASDVAAMIPSLLLPFNLIKSLLNSSLVLLLYKPVVTALRKSKLVTVTSVEKSSFSKKNTVITTALAVTVLIACIAVFVFVLDGNFQLFG